MGIFPYANPVPLFIHCLSGRYTGTANNGALGIAMATASAAWPAANLAIYCPLFLPTPYKVQRVWWANGATVNGNVDLALYGGASGVKIASTGAVAQAGASAPQFVTKDWLIQPGEYYLGLSSSSGTATFQRTNTVSVAVMRLLGCLQESTAHPLPATMTGVAIAQAYWPVFGLSSHASF